LWISGIPVGRSMVAWVVALSSLIWLLPCGGLYKQDLAHHAIDLGRDLDALARHDLTVELELELL
jgi:hypothetical protein